MPRRDAWYSTAPVIPESWLSGLHSPDVRWRPLPLVDVETPPADPRPIERAASELPLYDGWIAADAWAAHVLLERAGGALPSRLTTLSIGVAARWLLADYGIEPTIAADSVDEVLAWLARRSGRQERLLFPSGDAVASDLGRRVGPGLEVESPVAYGTAPAREGRETLRDLDDRNPIPILFTDLGSVAVVRRHTGVRAIRALALDALVAEALTRAGLTVELVGADPPRIAEAVAR